MWCHRGIITVFARSNRPACALARTGPSSRWLSLCLGVCWQAGVFEPASLSHSCCRRSAACILCSEVLLTQKKPASRTARHGELRTHLPPNLRLLRLPGLPASLLLSFTTCRFRNSARFRSRASSRRQTAETMAAARRRCAALAMTLLASAALAAAAVPRWDAAIARSSTSSVTAAFARSMFLHVLLSAMQTSSKV